MCASLPAATASRRGHSSWLWLSFVKQAAHTLPIPDDPEAGGPGLCFFVGGRVAEDELSDEEEAAGPEAGGSAAGVPAFVGGAVFSPGFCFLVVDRAQMMRMNYQMKKKMNSDESCQQVSRS